MVKKKKVSGDEGYSEVAEYYLESIGNLEYQARIMDSCVECPVHIKDPNSDFWHEKREDIFRAAVRIRDAHERKNRGEEVHDLELKAGVKPLLGKGYKKAA